MADNITITANANSTPPAGTVFRTDDISSVHYPVTKIALGADGALDTLVDSGQQTSANSLPVVIASDNNVLVKPFSAIIEGGLTELIGINEEVNQSDYSGSIGVALAGTYSGEILSLALYSTEDGSGAVQVPQGKVLIFDADPSIASGATAIAAAAFPTILGQIDFLTGDWHSDTGGGVAMLSHKPIPFHSLATLYFVWFQTQAVSWNDGAGDDEQLEFNFWYRRES